MNEAPCPFCKCTAKRYDLGIDSLRCANCGYTDYAAPQGGLEPERCKTCGHVIYPDDEGA